MSDFTATRFFRVKALTHMVKTDGVFRIKAPSKFFKESYFRVKATIKFITNLYFRCKDAAYFFQRRKYFRVRCAARFSVFRGFKVISLVGGRNFLKNIGFILGDFSTKKKMRIKAPTQFIDESKFRVEAPTEE